MQRKQAWEPDTHNSRFVILWDDENIDAPWIIESATHNGVEHPDPQALYDKHLAENRAKNAAAAVILANLPPHMIRDHLDADGDPTGQVTIKQKHWPVHAVAEDGTVTMSVPGADAALAAVLDEKCGDLAKVIPHEAK